MDEDLEKRCQNNRRLRDHQVEGDSTTWSTLTTLSLPTSRSTMTTLSLLTLRLPATLNIGSGSDRVVIVVRQVAVRPYGKQMDAVKNLTQEEVAEKMNVSMRMIRRLVHNSMGLGPFEVSCV